MEDVYKVLIEEAEDSASYAKMFDPDVKYEECFPFETYARMEKDGRTYRINIKVELV